MIVFGIILYVLLIAVLGITLAISVAPLFIGLIIIITYNLFSRSKLGKFAPIWWDVLTAVVTIFSTWMLWDDMWLSVNDFSAAPFIILFGYWYISFCYIVIVDYRKNKKKKRK